MEQLKQFLILDEKTAQIAADHPQITVPIEYFLAIRGLINSPRAFLKLPQDMLIVIQDEGDRLFNEVAAAQPANAKVASAPAAN